MSTYVVREIRGYKRHVVISVVFTEMQFHVYLRNLRVKKDYCPKISNYSVNSREKASKTIKVKIIYLVNDIC